MKGFGRVAIALVVLSGPAAAQDLSGAEIAATIAGKTILGNPDEGEGYAEYYAPDGTIRGDGYTGAWSVQGDMLCFAYGGEPAGCVGVRLNGDRLGWLVGGAVSGTATMVPGNVEGY